MLFQILFTVLFVWLMAGIIGLMLNANYMRPNVSVIFTVVLTAVIVGYVWDFDARATEWMNKTENSPQIIVSSAPTSTGPCSVAN